MIDKFLLTLLLFMGSVILDFIITDVSNLSFDSSVFLLKVSLLPIFLVSIFLCRKAYS